MSPSQTPRQIWAQQRIDEVYADNAHPYFAKSGGRKGRLNAAMLRLNQETAPPNRLQPGQQLISAATLMGSDAFASAEDAADFLADAAGNGAAPRAPAVLDLNDRAAAPSVARRRAPRIATTNAARESAVALTSARNGVSKIVPVPTISAKEPAGNVISDQAHATAPIQASPIHPQPPEIRNPTGGLMRFDNEGSGAFRAPRKHGPHKGVDVLTTPGDAVTSPIDGKIVRHGIVYGDKETMDGQGRQYYHVEIEGSGKYTGMTIRIFYIELNSRLATGTLVKAGQSKLGLSDDVRTRYGSKMKPHVHIEVDWRGEKKIDPTRVLPNLFPDGS